jgi:hypothetical protein
MTISVPFTNTDNPVFDVYSDCNGTVVDTEALGALIGKQFAFLVTPGGPYYIKVYVTSGSGADTYALTLSDPLVATPTP